MIARRRRRQGIYCLVDDGVNNEWATLSRGIRGAYGGDGGSKFAVPHNDGMDAGPSKGIGGRARGDARTEGLHKAAFGRRAHQRLRWDSGRVRRRCERKG